MTLPSPQEIKAFFPEVRLCVVKNFLLISHAMLSLGSCSLYKCAEEIPGKFHNAYTRLIRFVSMKKRALFLAGISRLLIALQSHQEEVLLLMDRTNWKLGSKPINILFIGMHIGEHLCIPIIWTLLDKNGSSSQDEREALMDRLLRLLPDAPSRFVLVGDREFVGRQWIQWLCERDVDLVIRLRREDYFEELSAAMAAPYLMKKMKKALKKKGVFCQQIELAGCLLYYVTLPCETAEEGMIFLLSSRPDTSWTSQTYRSRWAIELCFRHMKTNGLNLERSGLYDPDRFSVLLAAAVFAFALAVKQGLIEHEKTPIKTQRFGQRSYLRVSIFRYGYRALRKMLKTAGDFFELARSFIHTAIPKMGPAWGIKLKSV